MALALIEHLAAVYDVEFHKGPAHPRSCYWHPRRAAGGEDNAAASRSCATDVCTERVSSVTVHAGVQHQDLASPGDAPSCRVGFDPTLHQLLRLPAQRSITWGWGLTAVFPGRLREVAPFGGESDGGFPIWCRR